MEIVGACLPGTGNYQVVDANMIRKAGTVVDRIGNISCCQGGKAGIGRPGRFIVALKAYE